jgi:phytoene dehydrogenase-like protein
MQTEMLIIGAGASGLMTALELARAGKDTLILEARERIGGRIWPLPIEALGYPAQGGAEFVHGDASVTTALLRQAGLTLLPLDGEVWSLRGQHLTKRVGGPTHDPAFLAHKGRLHDTLLALTDDISIAQFLERYFKEDQYLELREWVRKMVEGYDAADPCRASTFALREGWLNGEEWQPPFIPRGSKFSLRSAYSDLREAISIEKRYFTSDLSSRS